MPPSKTVSRNMLLKRQRGVGWGLDRQVFLESRRGQEYVRRAGKAGLNIWGVSEVTPMVAVVREAGWCRGRAPGKQRAPWRV